MVLSFQRANVLLTDLTGGGIVWALFVLPPGPDQVLHAQPPHQVPLLPGEVLVLDDEVVPHVLRTHRAALHDRSPVFVHCP